MLIYFLFGRDGKAFSKRRELLKQDLGRTPFRFFADPVPSGRGDRATRAESLGRRKLMRLVRHNSYSVLTTRNRVEIQQDAAMFYPSLIEDMKAARHSIHLQYFIWGADPFTGRLKESCCKGASGCRGTVAL